MISDAHDCLSTGGEVPCDGRDCFSAFDFLALDNNLCLTRQLEITADEEARENLRRLIADRSPMSWAHIYMLGECDLFDDVTRQCL